MDRVEHNQSFSDFTMVIIFLKIISKIYMVIFFWIYYGDHFLMLIIFYTCPNSLKYIAFLYIFLLDFCFFAENCRRKEQKIVWNWIFWSLILQTLQQMLPLAAAAVSPSCVELFKYFIFHTFITIVWYVSLYFFICICLSSCQNTWMFVRLSNSLNICQLLCSCELFVLVTTGCLRNYRKSVL